MRKLKYETPELRIALTEADIKANQGPLNSADAGGDGVDIPGFEMPDELDTSINP